MINRLSYLLALFTVSFIAYSFSHKQEKPLQEKNGLRLYEMKGSTEFPEAAIKLVSTPPDAPGKATFQFEVSNFKLGMQTPDAQQKLCANSSKGQHIHFIMDNQPYFASYESTVEWDVKKGHHVLLAFLSRSYHESIKKPKAFVLKEFSVGKEATDNFDETAPHLFYSRPKGEYIGESEVQRLMIDFYLVNCTLSEKGYKVKATVNGTEFILTKWVPYYIEGLPLGDVKVKLELLDKRGKPVSSPFNGTERTISLKTEPFKK